MWSRPVGFVATYALATALLTAQSAGPPALRDQASPALREIGAHYFELLHESQIWINVQPESRENGPPPVIINLTWRFPDVRSPEPPASVAVRAQPVCVPVVFPQRVRQPILRFVARGSVAIDLTARGRPYQFVAGCSRSQSDTVIAPLSLAVVRRIAASADVTVDALGFDVRLTPDDMTAWRRFIAAVEHGAAVMSR